MTSHIFGLNKSSVALSIDERIVVDNVDPFLIEKIHKGQKVVSQEIPCYHIENNEYVVLKNGSSSVIAKYCPFSESVIKVETQPAYGISPKNAGQTMALDALLDPKIKLVTLSGKAGTGKTLIALAAALENSKIYRRIMMARPVVAMQDMGYLPGDINEKLEPYMMPLKDNLSVIRRQQKNKKAVDHINEMIEKEKIVIEPLAYIRGRSFHGDFIIIDEAQNLTPHEVKTIVTRAGEGTKIVLTGDADQIDTPKLKKDTCGFTHLINRFSGQKIFSHVYLDKCERSELAELASQLL